MRTRVELFWAQLKAMPVAPEGKATSGGPGAFGSRLALLHWSVVPFGVSFKSKPRMATEL
jgi:hypothetical protein